MPNPNVPVAAVSDRSIDFANFDPKQFAFDKLDSAIQAKIIEAFDAALGFTPERAAEFIQESRAEHAAGDADTDPYKDATGKFKHFLRVDRGWEGGVDAVWPGLEPLAAAVVEAVKEAGG